MFWIREEVRNQQKMEYELDQIKIGERKLHANLPRFQRNEGKADSVETNQRTHKGREVI